LQIISKLVATKLLRTIALLMRNLIAKLSQNSRDQQGFRRKSGEWTLQTKHFCTFAKSSCAKILEYKEKIANFAPRIME